MALTLTKAYQLTPQKGKVKLRLKIVRTFQECGSLRETARRLSVSRNTCAKWVRRYLAEEKQALWIDPVVPTTAPAAPHRRWRRRCFP